MGLAQVSNLLHRERQLLESLLFKLEEEQLLLAGRKSRWLAMASREVEAVLEAVRVAGLAGPSRPTPWPRNWESSRVRHSAFDQLPLTKRSPRCTGSGTGTRSTVPIRTTAPMRQPL